jgi:hypothetical protein
MAGIWLFLLGLSRFLTGRFSPVEIALILVIGVACLVGLAATRRVGHTPLRRSFPTMVIAAGLQSFALWLSYQPVIIGN